MWIKGLNREVASDGVGRWMNKCRSRLDLIRTVLDRLVISIMWIRRAFGFYLQFKRIRRISKVEVCKRSESFCGRIWLLCPFQSSISRSSAVALPSALVEVHTSAWRARFLHPNQNDIDDGSLHDVKSFSCQFRQFLRLIKFYPSSALRKAPFNCHT